MGRRQNDTRLLLGGEQLTIIVDCCGLWNMITLAHIYTCMCSSDLRVAYHPPEGIAMWLAAHTPVIIVRAPRIVSAKKMCGVKKREKTFLLLGPFHRKHC